MVRAGGVLPAVLCGVLAAACGHYGESRIGARLEYPPRGAEGPVEVADDAPPVALDEVKYAGGELVGAFPSFANIYVIAQDSIPDWVARALRRELRRAGARPEVPRSGNTAPVLVVAALKVWFDGAEARVELGAAIRSGPDWVLTRQYVGLATPSHLWPKHSDRAADALAKALLVAARQLAVDAARVVGARPPAR